jgi:hypothetical protein
VKFFEVKLAVKVREALAVGFGARRSGPRLDPDLFEDRELVVSVAMGNDATRDDAVEELARRLEKLCNDEPRG